jgi:MoxR-like ATPase
VAMGTSVGQNLLQRPTVERVAEAAARVRTNVARVIVGKDEAITLLLVALFCEGHVLIEDVPGVGKTMLARALAKSLDLTFQRIQFTPDLSPSDVTGLGFFNQKTQEFQFRPGPIFANLVLADEINRATPRTQSALLEAMQERQVTVDGETRCLSSPFLVLATENPIEQEGTFPLPEAQLDRFLVRIRLGYPEREEERLIVRRFRTARPLEEIGPVLPASEISEMGAICRQVFLSEAVEEYVIDLMRATRDHPSLALGASPRATLALVHASQALAAINGRHYVLPDDVKVLAAPVLEHRLIVATRGQLAGHSSSGVIAEILATVPAPVEDVNGVRD